MAVTVNGSAVSASTPAGDAIRANTILEAYVTARSQGAAAVATWWTGLTAAQQVHFIIDLTLYLEAHEAKIKNILARLARAGL